MALAETHSSEEPSQDLRRSLAAGFLWSSVDVLAQRSVQFVVGIILARMLLPQQFGAVAIVMIFVQLAAVFVNGGFGSALIQKRNVTYADQCSVFYLQLALAGCLAGAICITAPWIAEFFHLSSLSLVVRLLSLCLIWDGAGEIQRVMAARSLDFRVTFVAGGIGTSMSGAVAICLAISGWGIWSLVAQALVASLLRTVLLWCLQGWRPGLCFSVRSIRTLLPFGIRLFFAQLIDQFFSSIYKFLIGHGFSASAVGLYSRADTLRAFPVRTLTAVVNRVTYPFLCSIQDSPMAFRQAVRSILNLHILIVMPMMAGLALVAPHFVSLVLTDKWLPCVPYLQLLCIVGVFYPISHSNLTVIKSIGRSDVFLRLEITTKLMVAVAVAISWSWGIKGLIVGQVVTTALSYCLTAWVSGRLGGISLLNQLADYSRVALATAIMMCAVFCAATSVSDAPTELMLAFEIATGVVAYSFACWAVRPYTIRNAAALLAQMRQRPRVLVSTTVSKG